MRTQHRVTFREVGRFKQTWTADLPDLSVKSLYKAVRNAQALASRGIDFVFDDTGHAGVIYVGGFRKVGTFVVHNAD